MTSTSDRPVCDYEGSSYQAVFWDQGGRAYEDRAERVALHRLLPLAEQKGHLLEIGAGAGRLTEEYAGFERVVLLDYSRTQLEQAQKRLGNSERYVYVAANVYQLPFVAGAFQAAAMVRVLHHLADVPAALRQIRRVLQPNATYILEYANKQNLKAILRFLLRQQRWNPFSLEPAEFVALNFDFHPRYVREQLAAADFTLQRQLTVSHYRLGVLKRTVPTDWLVQLDALAQLTGDWWQISPSVFSKSRTGASGAVAPSGALFACPLCGGALHTQADELICQSPDCGKHWANRAGIYDFKEPLG
jgi:SAM-dependent methyltransferase